MTQGRKVRISNSTLNCYGTRVLTPGVDLTQFRRNPILLWMHNRPYRGTKDEVLPIGTVTNIQIEGDDITGELVFDTTDEFAQKLAAKWDAGILKMVSPNFDVIATDDSPELALPGQTRATITKAKLIEVSVVDIGGNDANMVLSKDGNRLQLCEGGACAELPLLQTTNPNKNQQENDMSYTAIALKLGLPEGANEQEILAKMDELNALRTANETLAKERDELQLASITALVDNAIAQRKTTQDKKDHFIELGRKVGIESLRLTLDSIAPVNLPSEQIHPGGGKVALSGEWKKLSDVPTEKLMELRKSDPATYMALYKVEYGMDCPPLQ